MTRMQLYRRVWLALVLAIAAGMCAGTVTTLALEGHRDTAGAVLLAVAYLSIPGWVLWIVAGARWSGGDRR